MILRRTCGPPPRGVRMMAGMSVLYVCLHSYGGEGRGTGEGEEKEEGGEGDMLFQDEVGERDGGVNHWEGVGEGV